MKIAIVTDAIYPFTLGGSEIRNHEIAKRLIKKGHEIHIYGGKFWDGTDIIKIDNIIIHGVSKYKKLYNTSGKRKPFESLFLSFKIFRHLLKEDYDIIDTASFNFFNCYTTKIVSLIKKTPLVFTWHQYLGNYLLGYFGKTKGIFAKFLEKQSTKLTKNHLAVSNKVKDDLISQNVNKNNIKVIYNGADLSLIKSIKSQKKKYDLIFVGRLNYQKNLDLLIDSVKILTKDIPKIRILIIGDGEEKRRLIGKVKKLNLSKNFEFVGEIKDKKTVFKYLKSSKVFVLPSILEGFPLTIIEANACGLPVITTKTIHNNTTEYIKDNLNGLSVKLNPRDFSNAIKKFLNNKKFIKKTSINSIKKARNYDWDILAYAQMDYYKQIIKNYNPK